MNYTVCWNSNKVASWYSGRWDLLLDFFFSVYFFVPTPEKSEWLLTWLLVTHFGSFKCVSVKRKTHPLVQTKLTVVLKATLALFTFCSSGCWLLRLHPQVGNHCNNRWKLLCCDYKSGGNYEFLMVKLASEQSNISIEPSTSERTKYIEQLLWLWQNTIMRVKLVK